MLLVKRQFIFSVEKTNIPCHGGHISYVSSVHRVSDPEHSPIPISRLLQSNTKVNLEPYLKLDQSVPVIRNVSKGTR